MNPIYHLKESRISSQCLTELQISHPSHTRCKNKPKPDGENAEWSNYIWSLKIVLERTLDLNKTVLNTLNAL